MAHHLSSPVSLALSPVHVGEDATAAHQNDLVWAYGLTTGNLSRIFSTPYGEQPAEPKPPVYMHAAARLASGTCQRCWTPALPAPCSDYHDYCHLLSQHQ